MGKPTGFAADISRNIRLATAVTIVSLGIGPLGFLLDFLPRGPRETVTDVMMLVFLCSPLLFLIALFIPVVTSPKGPTDHGPLRSLVPRWLLATAAVVTVPALAAPLFFADPFLRYTEVTDYGRQPFTAVAWTVYACFLGGLLLAVSIVADCRGRAELDPHDEPRTRRVIATRAVTALVPLAAMSCAAGALSIGAAGDAYRRMTERGEAAPERWAFAAAPGFYTAAIVVLIVTAILLIAAATVFRFASGGEPTARSRGDLDAAGSPVNDAATPPVR